MDCVIELRPFSKADIKSIVKYANNKNVAAGLREIFPSPYTKDDARWWIEHGQFEANSYNLAIAYQSECIGSVGIGLVEGLDENTVEMGYWLGEPYWGRGIATFAIKLMTDKVFTQFKLKQILALVAGPNRGSMKALEKNGFRCVAIRKNAIQVRAGLFDEHKYVKINSSVTN